MFVFAYPWLLVLLPLPWLLRMVLPPRPSDQIAVRVPFGERLTALLGRGTATLPRNVVSRSIIVAIFTWVFIIIAIARPQWLEPPLIKEIPTRDLLLLVDLSGSMDQQDFLDAQGKQVNRLTAVQEVLGDFLRRRKGDRVGLIVFGDSPYLQAPFSTDLTLSERLLEECQVGMAGPRTALGDAIGLGVNLFDNSDAPTKTIIALTDGNDTKSQVPPVEAARVAAQRDIQIFTVAIGDPTTVGEDKLDEQALRDVAKVSGGSYYFAADRKSLEGIYDELDRLESHQVKTISHRPRRDLYAWFLLVGLGSSMLDKLYVSIRKKQSHGATHLVSRVQVNPRTGKLEVTS